MAENTHWNDKAEGYDDVMDCDPSLKTLREAVVKNVSQRRKVLDLGCGTGAILKLVERLNANAELTGCDPAPEMLRIAREQIPSAQFVCASAASLPLGDKSFDAVVSCFALHHLTHEAKLVAAREMYRLLEPGGVVSLGDQFVPIHGDNADIEWTRTVLRHFARKAEYYLDTAGSDRMLLQVELLPLFLRCEEELPVPPEYWLDALTEAGFENPRYEPVSPIELLHGVLVAQKAD